ncbi:MAG: flagellin [Hyphomonadaceae bacterium]|nr:flagellin [Hyphomonadaceae bacterium]
MTSINTNRGAMVALQSLSATNRDLFKTQNAVSTGLKVANVKDNAAIWAIANKMTSDVRAYDRVTESAERALAKVDVAITSGETIMELLNEMKGKALAATQPGISAATSAQLNADYVQLRDQITSTIANATFDGANMSNGAAVANSAVALGDAAGGNNIIIAGANIGLAGPIVTVTAASDVNNNANATTALGLVNTSINNLGTQLATWGAASKRVEMHKQFVSKLQDALNSGIGAMVDADLSKESSRLQALQVKQQLGIQALSIANSSAQSALSLFR